MLNRSPHLRPRCSLAPIGHVACPSSIRDPPFHPIPFHPSCMPFLDPPPPRPALLARSREQSRHPYRVHPGLYQSLLLYLAAILFAISFSTVALISFSPTASQSRIWRRHGFPSSTRYHYRGNPIHQILVPRSSFHGNTRGLLLRAGILCDRAWCWGTNLLDSRSWEPGSSQR